MDNLPEKQISDFYRYGIFIVFAVVIAGSFPIFTKIFLPFNNLFTYNGFENGLALVFTFLTILSSWLYYFKAISIDKHTETKIGLFRFLLDLFIVYLYYYLISQASDTQYHKDIFVYTIPVIFACYLLWDFLRFIEYKKVTKEPKRAHADRKFKLLVSGSALGAFMIVSLVYT